MEKSQGKHEYELQIGMAQFGIDKIKEMGISVQYAGSRSKEVIRRGLTVREWAEEYDVFKGNEKPLTDHVE